MESREILAAMGHANFQVEPAQPNGFTVTCSCSIKFSRRATEVLAWQLAVEHAKERVNWFRAECRRQKVDEQTMLLRLALTEKPKKKRTGRPDRYRFPPA